jgi:PAS domain S-box-containing protein
MSLSADVVGPVEASEILAEAAKRTVALVGDGCVVRAVEGGELAAVAAEHLLDEGRRELESVLSSPPVRVEGSWLGQALERRQTVRLPDLGPEALEAAGLPPGSKIRDAMVVPLPEVDAVIVAVRNPASEDYAGSQRHQVEAIAADADARIRGGEPASVGPAPGPGEFDPVAHGLLDATSAALWVVDDNGVTIYVNEAASELVGTPAQEILGRPIGEYLHRVSQRRRGGFHGSETIERPLMRADGSVVWLLSSSRPLSQGTCGGNCTLYTLTGFDELHTRDVALRLRLARTEALLELAESAGAGQPFEELLDAAVALIAEQLDVELAVIASCDLDRLEGRILAHRGWPESGVGPDGQPEAVPMSERSAGAQALRSGEPVLVWDYEGQAIHERSPKLVELGVRSAAVVPFVEGTAAVAAHSPRPGAIDGEGVHLLESVARLLAPRWQVTKQTEENGSGLLLG